MNKNRHSIAFNANIPSRHFLPGAMLKRFFDVCVSGLGLIILSPVFLFLAWLIKRDSSGPIFYRGSRAGLGGKIFLMLKFRSMYERPESYQGPPVTAQKDPRITPFGRWLRDTKLNELPQLWNVFKGDMSLVGPRPEDPEIAAVWPDEVRQEMLSVCPGITSPASVLYRDEENLLETSNVMDTYFKDILPSKMRLDQLYVRHRSFWGDLDIIFYTILILFRLYKQAAPHDELLFLSPITNLFRRHISWFSVDLLITFFAIGLTGLLWRSFGPLDVGLNVAVPMAIGFAILFSVTNALMGLNRINWSKASPLDSIDLIPGVFLATALALVSNYLFPVSALELLYGKELPNWLLRRPLLDIGLIVIASALAFLGFLIFRYRSRLVTGFALRWMYWRGVANPAQERALIIGGGETGHFASYMFSNGRYKNVLEIVGFVDDDLYKLKTRIRGVNVIGQCSDIPELVSEYDIGIIIYAIHNITYKARGEILDLCYKTPARTVFFPDIPATLSDIVNRDNGMRHDKTQTSNQTSSPSSPGSDLPCHICLSKLSPPQVDAWLAKLESQARDGDTKEVLSLIQEMRHYVQGKSNALHPSEYLFDKSSPQKIDVVEH